MCMCELGRHKYCICMYIHSTHSCAGLFVCFLVSPEALLTHRQRIKFPHPLRARQSRQHHMLDLSERDSRCIPPYINYATTETTQYRTRVHCFVFSSCVQLVCVCVCLCVRVCVNISFATLLSFIDVFEYFVLYVLMTSTTITPQCLVLPQQWW